MRTLIRNATLIDGSGEPAREHVTLVLDDHQIAGVIPRPSPYYDRADEIIDALGELVIPGVLNHHVHGLTRGPLMFGRARVQRPTGALQLGPSCCRKGSPVPAMWTVLESRRR